MSTRSTLWARPFVPMWVTFIYACVLYIGISEVVTLPNTRIHRAIMLALLSAGFALGALGSARRRAEIGAEGIRVVGWLFGQRMIPYRDVRRAAVDGPTKLVVTTMRGETIALYAGAIRATMPKDVLENFWRAIAAAAEDGTRGIERQALARSGRTTAEWRRALRDVARPPTYRQATIAHERLWAIAENPGNNADVRVAAIVALSFSSLDEAARSRIQKIDAATVDPGLHELLERAAHDDGALNDQAIDAALNGLRDLSMT